MPTVSLFCRCLSATLICIGVVALVGWDTGVRALQFAVGTIPPMNPVTAVALILGGFGMRTRVAGKHGQTFAETTLVRQQEFLRTVIDAIPNLVFIKDSSGRFVLVNEACASVYGTTVEDLVGKTDADFCSDPEELAQFLAVDRETIATGNEKLIPEERITDAQGNLRWLQTVKRPLKSVDGVSVHVLGVSADITARKEAEEKLLAGEQELKLAHEDLELQNRALEQMVRDRTKALEQAHIEMLKRLAIASEFRDDDTGEHTSRVSELSALIAEEMGLGEREVEMLRCAAALHDLGKIGVSDAIFLKPGKLTANEFEIMKTHTLIAGEILGGSSSPLLQMAERIALTHHEKWDGSGYPRGLRHEEIPIEGRIVAIADVFDALTHSRPYKPAWTIEDAVKEIVALRGVHFDPQVVQAFLNLVDYSDAVERKAA
jgi:putative two-component system response regulator